MSRSNYKLVGAMTRRHRHTAEPVDGDFAQAVAKRLESREIVCVPNLPVNVPEWFDVEIELLRRQQELKVEREARRQAEEAAQEARQTTASTLMGEIARAATGSGSTAVPLNGAAVLSAALGSVGNTGTINGQLPAST